MIAEIGNEAAQLLEKEYINGIFVAVQGWQKQMRVSTNVFLSSLLIYLGLIYGGGGLLSTNPSCD